jgi:putative restriction endonuclease
MRSQPVRRTPSRPLQTPWSVDPTRRADPTNGLTMCALHDRAFDRGLLAIGDDLRIIVARNVLIDDPPELHEVALLRVAGQKITLPERFQPDKNALLFRRRNVFRDGV